MVGKSLSQGFTKKFRKAAFVKPLITTQSGYYCFNNNSSISNLIFLFRIIKEQLFTV